MSNQDFLGIILDYDKENELATVEQRNYFKIGDEVQIFGPNTNIITFKVEKIIDEDNNSIDIARHPRQIIKINVPTIVSVNDIMRIKY